MATLLGEHGQVLIIEPTKVAAQRTAEALAEEVEDDDPECTALAAGRRIGRPIAHPEDKIEYARLLKSEGHTLGQIAGKTGIPKTSLHRYLRGAGPATVSIANP
jgi:hypothetical protein